MHIKEYVEARIAELREMQLRYEGNYEFNPYHWPVEQEEAAWFEQEMAFLHTEFGRDI